MKDCPLSHFFVLLVFVAEYFANGTGFIIPSDRSTKRSGNKLKQAKQMSFSVSEDTSESLTTHLVDGVVCREIQIDISVVGLVTVLEATAESQETLVDMALVMEDDDEDNNDLYVENKLAAGDPYGAVLWPAASVVANYILTSKTIQNFQELSILELGTGTGLVAISAKLGDAKNVLATDYEPFALKLTKYAAKHFHGLSLDTMLLDLCDYDTKLPKCDLVVAADIMYEPRTGTAMAHRAVEALKQGSRVIVGDSPGRAGRPAFMKTLLELGVSPEAKFVDTIGHTCTGHRHELICGKGSTSASETPQKLAMAIIDLNPSMLLN